MPTTATAEFAEFGTKLQFAEIPTEVVESAKLQLLDTLGCGLAAAAEGVAGSARRAVLANGGGRRDDGATILGSAHPTSAADAALANGSLCHGLDFDNTHPRSICHTSAVVCPAALATAEVAGAHGREVVASIIIGNEVTARIGGAAPGEFHRRGLHPTSVCGVFGAAAASARALGLGTAETTDALGIAGSAASGLMAYLQGESDTKALHAGWASHGGIVAAMLAAHGATGPRAVLEGRFGLFEALLGEAVALDDQLGDLGERWETAQIATKAYPACHYMHGVLGALSAIEGEIPRPADIDEIVVLVPEATVPVILEPVEEKIAPLTGYDGKFSLQYSVAALAARGSLTLRAYDDVAVRDEDVLDLARRVRYEVTAFPATAAPSFPGGVRVVTRDGGALEAEALYEPGHPENPLPPGDVRAKFRANAAGALTGEAIRAVEGFVMTLERQADLRGVELLRAHAQRAR